MYTCICTQIVCCCVFAVFNSTRDISFLCETISKSHVIRTTSVGCPDEADIPGCTSCHNPDMQCARCSPGWWQHEYSCLGKSELGVVDLLINITISKRSYLLI